MEMTGFTREEIIGRSVEELGLFSNCETGQDALDRLEDGRIIRHREALIPIPEGDRLVIVAGEVIAVGEEPCMLFTFADLDGRRKAQNALRQSEERFFNPSAFLRLRRRFRGSKTLSLPKSTTRFWSCAVARTGSHRQDSERVETVG